jgi:protein-tyrosine-phosphatase/8-oxo-dGTP pyrophosphatase MutT (NUDIX family)
MVEKRIHFVCRGNTFRSRLAEAYAKSLKYEGYSITSSGIEATEHERLDVSPYTKAIAKKYKLTSKLAPHKQQSTKKMFTGTDVLVFLNKDIYEDALKVFSFDARKATVWNIDDLGTYLIKHPKVARNKANYVKITEMLAGQTFDKVDRLFDYLASTSWSDIYNADNKPLGYRLPVAWTTDRKGLWRRSVHAVVTTANGKFVVEKRSKNIVFAPGMLDISLGGGIDMHETPRQAVLRELREELGIKIRPEQLTHLGTRKWAKYHPHYDKYTNMFLYTYHVRLTIDDPIFVLQPSEVKEVRLLSGRQINNLLRKHRIKRFGRLNYGYKYYADAVKRAKMYVK